MNGLWSRVPGRTARLGWFGCLCLAASAAHGQSYVPQGGEYPIPGVLLGDQVWPSLSLRQSGGFVVWQDNATDGNGLGISAQRLQGDLLGGHSVFRVNQKAEGDQENPKVALIPNGGAVFVWQGGKADEQDVFARFMNAEGVFVSGDIQVNSFPRGAQVNPSVTVRPDGRVAVAWSSFGQDGSMQGVFAQVLSATGEKIGSEFQVNQYSSFNQRSPAVGSLLDGSLALAWVTEQARFEGSVDISARIFDGNTKALTGEFLINDSTNICANPCLLPSAGGGFTVAWSQRDIGEFQNGWDVFARTFDARGKPVTSALRVNETGPGNQFAPQLAAIGDDLLVVWTQSRQNGTTDGVFGRLPSVGGDALSGEFQINDYNSSRELFPSVASDGQGRFLVVWSSYIGGPTSYDLIAQRLAPSPITPSAPFVSALSSSRLSVTWPALEDQKLTSYELYVNGSTEPVVLTENRWTLSSLAPNSTHSFRLGYRFTDGSRSALSAVIQARTWGSDDNLDGLPDDWQIGYWGAIPKLWADPRADDDLDGATNLQEFLAGTSPKDSESVLRVSVTTTPQGYFLRWNAQPGLIYQVQRKTELTLDWTDVGTPRFARGAEDSMRVDQIGDSIFYRVRLLR